MSKAAERKRRYRQRQRKGERVYPAPVPDWVIEIAINNGWLSEEDSHDREKVGKFLAVIAKEWGDRWRDYFGTRTH